MFDQKNQPCTEVPNGPIGLDHVLLFFACGGLYREERVARKLARDEDVGGIGRRPLCSHFNYVIDRCIDSSKHVVHERLGWRGVVDREDRVDAYGAGHAD